MTRDRPETPRPPRRARVVAGALRRALVAALPDDAWSAEFMHELDTEHDATRSLLGPGWRSTVWYAGQVLAPRTLRFVWMMRRREAMIRGPGAAPLSEFWPDVGQSWRGITREPRTAFFIVLTLALGIGSVTAMYGVAERLFLSGPRHVASPSTMARMFLTFDEDRAGLGRASPWIPLLTATAIKEGAPSLSGVTLYRFDEQLGRVGSGVMPLRTSEVDGDYFDLLGARPAAGRFFGDDALDDEAGPVVIASDLAIAGFGSASASVGRTIELGKTSRVVVGVAPDGFAGPHLERVDVWRPIDRERAGTRNWWVVARLPSDASAARERASVEANEIHRRTDPGRSFRWASSGSIALAPLGSDDAGRASAESRVAALLLGVVLIVLLIACANVVNLLLARVTERHGEIVVRLALGIGRWRLARLLVAESLLLAAAGWLMSLPVARASGTVLRRTLLKDVAWNASSLDTRVVLMTFAGAVAVGLLVSLPPIRHASRTDLTSGLVSERHSPSVRRLRTQAALATTQIALASALLMCAGLFLESFRTIRATDLGVRDDVLAVQLRSLDDSVIRDGSDAERDAYRQALSVALDLPGVRRAALAVGLPFISNFGMSIWVPGFDSIPELPGGGPFVNAVGAGYFETAGTRILRGSTITESHVANAERVTVVSRTTAATLWPNHDPLGECVRRARADSECYRVVGVAEDVHRQGYREPPSMQLYIPLGTQEGFSGTWMIVRPERDGATVAERLRGALRDIVPAVDHVRVERLDALLEPQVRPWRLGAVVLSLTAAVAAIVSLLGVYGVLSCTVAQRRQEVGVRMVLGASTTVIQRSVVRRGMTWSVIGVACGMTLVVTASHLLTPLLFETSVADPLVMGAVAALLMGAAVAACLIPAVQASRVDPMAFLRGEG